MELRCSAERSEAYLTLTVLRPLSLVTVPLCSFTMRSTHRSFRLSLKRAVNFVLPALSLTVALLPNCAGPPEVFIARILTFAPVFGAPGLIVPETVTDPFLTLTEPKLTLVVGLDLTVTLTTRALAATTCLASEYFVWISQVPGTNEDCAAQLASLDASLAVAIF